jgi:diguanylate cyclase (GGDEF)-like protein/PAS domain S-box-containing protein
MPAAAVAERKQRPEVGAGRPPAFDDLPRLFEGSPDAVSVIRLGHARGSAGVAATDVSAPEIQGWVTQWSEPDRVAALKAIASAAVGRPGRFHGRRAGLDSELRWWDVVVFRAVAMRPASLIAVARDITDLSRHERALRESAERYRALAEASAVILWRAAADGSVVEISGGWRAFCGQDVAEYAGQGWLDVVHPDDRAGIEASWRRHVARQQPCTLRYRVKALAGAYRHVVVRGVPLHDPDGSVREWVGTLSDVHERQVAEDRLRDSEERYRALVEASASACWRASADGCLTEIVGWGAFPEDAVGALNGREWFNVVHPNDREPAIAAWTDAVATGRPFVHDYRLELAGAYRWVQARAVALRRDDGSVREWVGTIADIQDRRTAEEALRTGEERYRLAARATQDAIWDRDLVAGTVTWGNTSRGVFGYTEEQLGAEPGWWTNNLHPSDRDRIARDLAATIEGGERYWAGEYRFRRADGSYADVLDRGFGIRDEDGRLVRMVGAMQDVTDRKAADRELWRLANLDALTGLPNRARFQQRLEQALRHAEEKGTSVSLLMIDLDNFKDVNDSFGHDAGDAVLVGVAQRLSAVARECDTVARLGGDEFAVIVVEPLRLEHVERLAKAVAERFRKPFSYKDMKLWARGSIGLASYPEHDKLPSELLKDADIALYKAKAQGRNQVVTYTPCFRRAMEERALVVRELKRALKHAQIRPFYQPKICLETRRIVGFEALARWLHETRGVLTPAAFSYAFEEPELAVQIGACLVEAIARDIRAWLDQGLDCGRVGINFSSAEFGQPDLAERVLATFAREGAPTRTLEVEVTETVFLSGSRACIASTLHRFRDAGAQIALDDFGTGYASLAHLKQFPVDHIKIDQSFVRNLEADEDDAAIVRAVLGLGQSLRLKVTAEGVETEGQAAYLAREGCTYAQGYLFGQAVPAADAARLLEHGASQVF